MMYFTTHVCFSNSFVCPTFHAAILQTFDYGSDIEEVCLLTLLLTSLQCRLRLGFACPSYDRSKFDLDKTLSNCMAELKASEQGLKQIKQARDKKGWIVEDPRWLVEASKILDPERDWQVEEGIYANGVSSGTWKAFLFNKGRKKGIRTEVFKAYCQVLGISWEVVIEQAIENPVDSLQGYEANHSAERFNKAVQQLGSDNNYVRISSIYELEQILKDAEDGYYWKVIEILTLYVRQRSPWNKEKEAKAKTEQDIPPLPDDIQKVMTVLAQRKYTHGHRLEPHPLDLHDADLRRLQLPPNAQFNQADFQGSNLQEASLEKVNFQGANFWNANLQEANLEKADLQEAVLSSANLQNANLEEAILQKAILSGTELQRAILTGADLKEAKLWNANLQEASLEKADLRKAKLWKANLQNANLWKANLQDTDLEEANLQSATLAEARLQGANLRRAILQDIDFTNVNLQEANLEEAELDDSFGFDLEQVFSYKGAKFSDYWQL